MHKASGVSAGGTGMGAWVRHCKRANCKRMRQNVQILLLEMPLVTATDRQIVNDKKATHSFTLIYAHIHIHIHTLSDSLSPADKLRTWACCVVAILVRTSQHAFKIHNFFCNSIYAPDTSLSLCYRARLPMAYLGQTCKLIESETRSLVAAKLEKHKSKIV